MFPRIPTATSRRGLSSRGQASTGNRASTARYIQDRSVKDVSYFKGKIYAKITELRTELSRIEQETNALQRQETAISINTKKAQTMAEELTAKQALLADLNVAIDKVNTGFSILDIEKETSELRDSNDNVERERDTLYANRTEEQMKVSEMNSVISFLKKGQAALTSSDCEALRNDPRKLELAKLKLHLWCLENQKDSLNNELIASEAGDPEEEIALLFEKLGSLVVNKLKKILERVESFPKRDQYDKFLSKNMSDFAHEDTTPSRLLSDLGLYLEQVKLMDRNMDAFVMKFRDKTMDLKGLWSNRLSVTDLENSLNRKRSSFVNQKTNLECRNHSLQMTLDTRSAELENYHRQLMKSKDYSRICDLELKLSNYRRINHDLKEYLEEGKSLKDLEECKERTLSFVDRLNEKLKSSLNH